METILTSGIIRYCFAWYTDNQSRGGVFFHNAPNREVLIPLSEDLEAVSVLNELRMFFDILEDYTNKGLYSTAQICFNVKRITLLLPSSMNCDSDFMSLMSTFPPEFSFTCHIGQLYLSCQYCVINV